MDRGTERDTVAGVSLVIVSENVDNGFREFSTLLTGDTGCERALKKEKYVKILFSTRTTHNLF